MTHRAVIGEARLNVVRILRAIVIFQMATNAIGAAQLEVPVPVASGAVQLGVHAGEREAGKLEVIERCP